MVSFLGIIKGRLSLFAGGWFSANAGLHAMAILGIGDFGLVDPKTIQGNRMLGTFPLVVPAIAGRIMLLAQGNRICNLSFCTAHLEAAAGKLDHRHAIRIRFNR